MAGWLLGYEYRMPVEINPSKIPELLDDWVLCLTEVGMPAGFFSGLEHTDGRDIRWTSADGVTLLNHDLVAVSVGGATVEMHGKLPAVSPTLANPTIAYIYFGNADAVMPTAASQQAVWANGYAAVYHLGEAAGDLIDATSNGLDLTNNGGDYGTAGQIGDSLTFVNGNTDYAERDAAPFSDYPFTMECLVRSPNDAATGILMWVGDKNVEDVHWMLYLSSTGEVAARARNTTAQNAISAANYDDDTWQHVVAVFANDTSRKIYVNGVEEDEDTNSVSVADIDRLGIGANLRATRAGFHEGEIDEARFSSVARTLAEITASSNNQLDPATFYTVGAIEQPSIADHELGGWSDIIEFGGVVYLSRQNDPVTDTPTGERYPVLWQVVDLGGEPAGNIGELPICAVPTTDATDVTIDAGAVAIDAMVADGDYLHAAGWREEGTTSYLAFWTYDGSDWTLDGQLQRARGQLYGLQVMPWGLVASGPAGIYVARGAGVARDDTGTLLSRGSFAAAPAAGAGLSTLGEPHAIGARALIPDVRGGVWTSDGDGVWAHYGDAYVGEPFSAMYRGDIWRLSGASEPEFGAADSQELVRLTDAGSVQPVAAWLKTTAIYEVPARIRQGIVLFGTDMIGSSTSREIEGRVTVMERNKLLFHSAIDYQVYRARSGVDMLALAFDPPAPNYDFDSNGQLTHAWRKAKFQGGVHRGVFYPPVALRTSPDPAIWGITLEWADGNGLNRPQVDSITLEWADGDGDNRPRVDAITLEWARDDSPDVGGGDTILYVEDYDPVPAVAVRIISSGRLADNEDLWALVRADREDVPVDDWPSYQVVNFGATVELERPGRHIRVAIIKPNGMTDDPDIHIQLQREEL